jgi:hypothetical protein
MEAIMIGGLAVLLVGGYYSTVDFLNDLGVKQIRRPSRTRSSAVSRYNTVTVQGGVKKMAGMHI